MILYATAHIFTDSVTKGELEHRHCKRHYPRVHKGRSTAGIARHIRRERILHNIRKDREEQHPPRKKRRLDKSGKKSAENDERLPLAPPEDHYQMSNETRHPIELSTWLGKNEDDPALTVRPLCSKMIFPL